LTSIPSFLPKGLPPLVLRKLLDILTFLASSHNSVADILSCSDLQSCDVVEKDGVTAKDVNSDVSETPLMLFLKLLNTPLFLRSRVYIELVLLLLLLIRIFSFCFSGFISDVMLLS
jgi:hypothetical protein